jgi:putative hydrolase of the HAD superfamily
MFPRAILFDLDDTLFDHRRASGIALGAMHAAHAPDLPFAAFASRHAEILEAFHTRFLAGELTLDEARVARMQTLFAMFDRKIDAVTAGRAARLYREQHQTSRRLVAGAIELLEALRGRCRLGIVTNNSTAEQTEKLRALDIARYFDAVVISEDVGITKPDPEIFAIALQRIGARAQDAVFIGDNWTNDIAGARAAGMAAVWLNRDSETQALAGPADRKWLESRVNAGISHSHVATIDSLAPAAVVIGAIRKIFTKRTPGEQPHEQLETLAT